MRIDGQCHCGFVTYEAEIDPEKIAICHCTECQRLTGSPYRVTATASRAALRLTNNEPGVYEKTGDNGRTRRQYFCPHCGAPLFTTGTGTDAETIGIRWGSINQRAGLTPKNQIWCASAMDWFGELAALPGVSGD